MRGGRKGNEREGRKGKVKGGREGEGREGKGGRGEFVGETGEVEWEEGGIGKG